MGAVRRLVALSVAVALAGCVVPGAAKKVATSSKGKPAAKASLAPGKNSTRFAKVQAQLLSLAKVSYATNRATIVSNNGGSVISNNGGNIVSNNGGGIVSNNGGSLGGKRYRTAALDVPPIAPNAQAGESLILEQHYVDGSSYRAFKSPPAQTRSVTYDRKGNPIAEERVNAKETWPNGKNKTVTATKTLQTRDGQVYFYLETDLQGGENGLTTLNKLRPPAFFEDLNGAASVRVEKLTIDLLNNTGEFEMHFPGFDMVNSGTITAFEENSRLAGGDINPFDPLGTNAGTSEVRTTAGELLYTTRQTVSSTDFTRRVEFQSGLVLDIKDNAVAGASGSLLIDGEAIGKLQFPRAQDGSITMVVTFDDEPGKPYTLSYGPRGADQDGATPTPTAAPEPVIYWWTSSPAGKLGGGYAEGIGFDAAFNGLAGVGLYGGAIYVADSLNHRVRKLVSTKDHPEFCEVTTVAGTGTPGGLDGAAATAQLDHPTGLAIGLDGTMFVSETSGGRIRKITQDGTVSTFVGSAVAGFADGKGTAAKFNEPRALTLDEAGNLYVADTKNHAIRKVTPDGTVTTLAGDGKAGFADGKGQAAKFNSPMGITVGPDGTVYASDHLNFRLRRIDPQGNVTTVAGDGDTSTGAIDGPKSASRLVNPIGLALDTAGVLYFVDGYTIRQMKPDGEVSTVAGLGVYPSATRNGDMFSATFLKPFGLTVTEDGAQILVTDLGFQQVRALTLYKSKE